jgi:hypothetical protein
MPSTLEGGTQDGANAAGSNDADVEPGRSLCRCGQITHA